MERGSRHAGAQQQMVRCRGAQQLRGVACLGRLLLAGGGHVPECPRNGSEHLESVVDAPKWGEGRSTAPAPTHYDSAPTHAAPPPAHRTCGQQEQAAWDPPCGAEVECTLAAQLLNEEGNKDRAQACTHKAGRGAHLQEEGGEAGRRAPGRHAQNREERTALWWQKGERGRQMPWQALCSGAPHLCQDHPLWSVSPARCRAAQARSRLESWPCTHGSMGADPQLMVDWHACFGFGVREHICPASSGVTVTVVCTCLRCGLRLVSCRPGRLGVHNAPHVGAHCPAQAARQDGSDDCERYKRCHIGVD